MSCHEIVYNVQSNGIVFINSYFIVIWMLFLMLIQSDGTMAANVGKLLHLLNVVFGFLSLKKTCAFLPHCVSYYLVLLSTSYECHFYSLFFFHNDDDELNQIFFAGVETAKVVQLSARISQSMWSIADSF